MTCLSVNKCSEDQIESLAIDKKNLRRGYFYQSEEAKAAKPHNYLHFSMKTLRF